MDKGTFLTVSTVHIPQETADWLDAGNAPFTVWKSDYGWIMSIWPVVDGSGAIMPQPLADCMTLAKDNDCDFLRLDGDGTEYGDLPRYEWN